MKSRNGTDYSQNYDLITKWLSAAFKGETLEVLGLKTGRIEDVFGFEPADISVRTGRVDLMFRDDAGEYYHFEEQRNPRKTDLYRSGAYHFHAGGQWGPKITDIILVSGDVRIGDGVIRTGSGRYSPTIVDLSVRDGWKRLAEIREAVGNGTFENWLELVFLPLYGKETGDRRGEMAEQVLRFESELYKAKKLPATLLAAALVMSNKLVAKDRLRALWEEIKMLDILEIAREEGLKEGLIEGKDLGLKEGKDLGLKEGKDLGLKEGKDLGLREGILASARELVVDAMIEKFAVVPEHVSQRIRAIRNSDTLKALFRQILRCEDIRDFETILNRMTT